MLPCCIPIVLELDLYSFGPSFLRSRSFPLDAHRNIAHFPGSLRRGSDMSRVCSITGAKPTRGSVIHRRGMAKKKGGVGRHVTANTPRTFLPNLRTRRIWIPELNKFVTIKLSARALK